MPDTKTPENPEAQVKGGRKYEIQTPHGEVFTIEWAGEKDPTPEAIGHIINSYVQERVAGVRARRKEAEAALAHLNQPKTQEQTKQEIADRGLYQQAPSVDVPRINTNALVQSMTEVTTDPEFMRINNEVEELAKDLDKNEKFKEYDRLARQYAEVAKKSNFEEIQKRLTVAGDTSDTKELDRIAKEVKGNRDYARAFELVTQLQALNDDPNVKLGFEQTKASIELLKQNREKVDYLKTLQAEFAKYPEDARQDALNLEQAKLLKVYAAKAIKVVEEQIKAMAEGRPVSEATVATYMGGLGGVIGGAKGNINDEMLAHNLYSAKDLLQKVIDTPIGSGYEAADFLEGLKQSIKNPEIIPFVGSLFSMAENYYVKTLVDKPGDERTDSENALVDAYAAWDAVRNSGQTAQLYDIAVGIANLVPYAVEFGVTSRLFSATRKLVIKGIQKGILETVGRAGYRKILGHVVDGSLAGQIMRQVNRTALKLGPALVGSLTQSLANPQRIAADWLQREIPAMQLGLSTEGDILSREINKKGDSFENFLKAAGVNAAEFVTERWGIVVEKPVDFMQKMMLGKWMRKHGVTKAADMLKTFKGAMAWHGVAAEWFEEYANAPIQSLIESGTPQLMNMREALTTLGVLIVPGAIGTTAKIGGERLSDMAFSQGEVKHIEDFGKALADRIALVGDFADVRDVSEVKIPKAEKTTRLVTEAEQEHAARAGRLERALERLEQRRAAYRAEREKKETEKAVAGAVRPVEPVVNVPQEPETIEQVREELLVSGMTADKIADLTEEQARAKWRDIAGVEQPAEPAPSAPKKTLDKTLADYTDEQIQAVKALREKSVKPTIKAIRRATGLSEQDARHIRTLTEGKFVVPERKPAPETPESAQPSPATAETPEPVTLPMHLQNVSQEPPTKQELENLPTEEEAQKSWDAAKPFMSDLTLAEFEGGFFQMFDKVVHLVTADGSNALHFVKVGDDVDVRAGYVSKKAAERGVRTAKLKSGQPLPPPAKPKGPPLTQQAAELADTIGDNEAALDRLDEYESETDPDRKQVLREAVLIFVARSEGKADDEFEGMDIDALREKLQPRVEEPKEKPITPEQEQLPIEEEPEAEEPEEEPEEETPPEEIEEEEKPADSTYHAKMANLVVDYGALLDSGVPISNQQVQDEATARFGGTRAEGVFTPRDMYDALEAAVAKRIIQDEIQTLEEARNLMKILPTQRTRDKEQEELQQFSTPPTIGILAVESLGTVDHLVLEPSAGTGLLASLARARGLKVAVNEVSERRLGLLQYAIMGWESVTNADAEFLGGTLDTAIQPTGILMNPPFSATGGRVTRHDSKYGARHIEQALYRLRPGGRLVAIVPTGMDMHAEKMRGWWDRITSKYHVIANIGIPRDEYGKMGTTFPVRIVVIDKVDSPTAKLDAQKRRSSEYVKQTDYERLEDALPFLRRTGNERQEIQDTGTVASHKGEGGGGVGGERGQAGPGRGGAGLPEPGGLERPVKPPETGVTPTGTEKPRRAPRVGKPRGRGPGESGEGGDTGVAGTPRQVTKEEAEQAIKNIMDSFKEIFGGGPEGVSATVLPGLDPVKLERFFDKNKENFKALWLYTKQNVDEFMKALGATPRNIKEYLVKRVKLEFTGIEPDDMSTMQNVGELDLKKLGIKLEKAPPVENKEEGTAFVTHSARKLTGAPKPTWPIVESAAMASVESPDITYTPHLPEDMIELEMLSEHQLEGIMYAGMRHAKLLPNGERAGFFIGDGTGTGKGRQIAAIIADNWFQGRRRAIWVSYNKDLYEDAERDFIDIGMKGVPLKKLNDWKGEDKIDMGDGVIFVTYSTLWHSTSEGKTRIAQLLEWLGEDSVIVFDEAHKAKNAKMFGAPRNKKAKRGQMAAQEGSKSGQAVVDLQNALPKARVVYSSATGATELGNMSYLTRLGLWGEDTPFKTFGDFVATLGEAGIGVMEQVARDMKAMGMYVSRSLSFRGVEYDQIEVTLTDNQVRMYNIAADKWLEILRLVEEVGETTNMSGGAKGLVYQNLFSAQPRFFNQLLTSMKVPAMLKLADKELEAGNAVVISMVNTNESAMERKVTKAAEEETDIDELDFTPREIMYDLIDKHFPTTQFVEEEDENGKVRKVPLIGADGNPVQNPEAVRQKQKLLDSLNDIQIPENPLDQILMYYEAKDIGIAELTGRKRRRKVNPVSGKIEIVPRAGGGVTQEAVANHERDRFQNGEALVAVLTNKASTGISLHSDSRVKNQRRRIQIALQLRWSADQEMQMFGRTHRANQVSAPRYVLMASDVSGESRFIATTARRLTSLGALTRGQENAAGGALLEGYEFDSPYGMQALAIFLDNPGWTAIKTADGVEFNLADVLKSIKMMKRDEKGFWVISDTDKRNIRRFLNRILMLQKDMQTAVFEGFFESYTKLTNRLKENETFDAGVSDLKVDSLKLLKSTLVREDKENNTKTELQEFEAGERIARVSWDEIEKFSKDKPQQGESFYRQDVSGHWIYVRRGPDKTDPKTGDTHRMWRVTSPYGWQQPMIKSEDLAEKYTIIDNIDEEELENPRQDLEEWWKLMYTKAPPQKKSSVFLLTGVLLPVWRKISHSQAVGLKIYRVVTDDGERFVGVRIKNTDVPNVLAALGVERKISDKDLTLLYNGLRDGSIPAINLDGGMAVVRKKVMKEARIELVGGYAYQFDDFEDMGLLRETIDYKVRFFIPDDPVRGPEILGKILKEYPMVQPDSTDEHLNADKAVIEPNRLLSMVYSGSPNPVRKALRDQRQKQKTATPQVPPATPQPVEPPPGVAPSSPIKETQMFPQKLNPMEFPELVELARILIGSAPRLGKFRGKAGFQTRGMFYPGPERGAVLGDTTYIKLNRAIFKEGNDLEIAKTLAHEIGHLVDWFPHDVLNQGTLKRGNLLGHLLVLKNFMNAVFGPNFDRDLRDELWELSSEWRPLPPNPPTHYVRYRREARELYADFFSALMLDPGWTERVAPKTFQLFFENISKKPAVESALNELLSLLTQDRDELLARRKQRTMEDFAEARKVMREYFLKRRYSRYNWWVRWRSVLGNRFAWAWQDTEEVLGREIIPPEESPIHDIEAFSYVDGKTRLYLNDMMKQVIKPLEDAGITLDDAGFYAMLRRIASGDRAALALGNPRGYTPTSAKEQLEKMKKDMGAAQYGTLEQIMEVWYDLNFAVTEEAFGAGILSETAFEEVAGNQKYYATFAVIKYLKESSKVPPGIKKQVGTLEEIGNPFVFTVLKTTGLIRLTSQNNAKQKALGFITKYYPEEISTRPKNYLKAMGVFRSGAYVTVWVDPLVADSFELDKDIFYWTILRWMDKWFNNTIFKKFVITYNVGFQIFNVWRDFARTYKALVTSTGASMWDLIKEYRASTKIAKGFIGRRHWIRGKARDTEGEIDDTIRAMLEHGAISTPFVSYAYLDEDQTDKAGIPPLEADNIRQLIDMGILTPQGELVQTKLAEHVLKPIKRGLEVLEFMGAWREIRGKIAAWRVLQKRGLQGKRLAFTVRNYSGTPNYRNTGHATKTTNAMFVFSNIMFEGVRSSYRLMTNPTTRFGYLWRMSALSIIPKIFQIAAEEGLFDVGPDEEEGGIPISSLMKKVDRYFKQNYLVIPIAATEDGKAVVITLPKDEFDRLISGVIYGTYLAGKDIASGDASWSRLSRDFYDVIGFSESQLSPALSPTMKVPYAFISALLGTNPTDTYRMRPVVPDDVWEAGGFEKWSRIVEWSVDQFGVFRFNSYNQEKDWTVESVLRSIPIIGRFIRVTDYGEREAERRELEILRSEKATERVESDTDEKRAVRRLKSDISRKRELWVDRMAKAQLAEDMELINEIREEIFEFNREYPGAAIKMQGFQGSVNTRRRQITFEESRKESKRESYLKRKATEEE